MRISDWSSDVCSSDLTAADLSKCYKVPAEMVAVTATAPGSVARNPEELADKLARFAAAESAKHGVEFGSHAITSPDPAIDLDERPGSSAHEIGADLIVMGYNVPGFVEHLFASNARHSVSTCQISLLLFA